MITASSDIFYLVVVMYLNSYKYQLFRKASGRLASAIAYGRPPGASRYLYGYQRSIEVEQSNLIR